MNERLPKGVRKHISKHLKPEARSSDSEQVAWETTEKILELRIPSFPFNYHDVISAIRRFHELRWEMNHNFIVSEKERTARLAEFQSRYTEDILEKASTAFSVISQIYSK